jgi:ubiquinone/menaquinone biosynthesis C-methylase UbiE
MAPDEMPDLLRFWYLGTRARNHMMLRRFAEVDVEVSRGAGSNVLDIGSAWGYNVLALSRMTDSVVGMDLVVDQFEAGARIAEANGMTLPAIGADASALPFADGRFTGITMVETLEHIFEADRLAALRECHRVLETGGRLVLSTPNVGSLVERLKRLAVRHPWIQRRLPTMCYPADDTLRDDYHPYRYHQPWSPDRITDELEGLGFKVLKIKRFLFVLKNTSDSVYPLAALAEKILEKTPVLNRFAATVCVVAEKT